MDLPWEDSSIYIDNGVHDADPTVGDGLGSYHQKLPLWCPQINTGHLQVAFTQLPVGNPKPIKKKNRHLEYQVSRETGARNG